jgi:hypothetical protein
VEPDASLGEHLLVSVAECGPRGGHGKRLGGVDVDAGVVAYASVAQRGLDEKRRLIRGGGALVGQT